eukprot:TRINITY_DN10437_c0_g1_i3.p1 TRINITY_DN10437_c0_g1~~TRINITY_DN10437_c0_g1_i3.p1  ORF type:complete len:772 (-),score=167.58 TRINITY_DN10437_c0_g1_i3:62-2104(-)
MKKLVSNVSQYIINYLNKFIKRDESIMEYEKNLLCESISCLHEMVQAVPWVMRDHFIADLVTRCAFMGLNVFPDDFTKEIKEPAQKLMHYILYDHGRKFTVSAPSFELDRFTQAFESTMLEIVRESGFMEEDGEIGDISATSVFRQYRFKDTSLLTTIQLPNLLADPIQLIDQLSLSFNEEKTEESFRKRWIQGYQDYCRNGAVMILTRNLSGKFLWEAHPVFLPRGDDHGQANLGDGTPQFENVDDTSQFHDYPSKDLLQEAAHNTEFLLRRQSISSSIRKGSINQARANAINSYGVFDWWKTNTYDTSICDKISELCDTQIRLEGDAASRIPQKEATALAAPKAPSLARKASAYRVRESRILLGNTGLLQPLSRRSEKDSVHLMVPSRELAKRLGQVDETTAHEVFTVAVLYRKPGQATLEEVLSNRESSQDFDKFIRGLGRMVAIKDCKGFSGGLTCDDADIMPYFVSPDFETFFLIPSLMKCDIGRKNTVFQSNLVRVVWSDDPQPILFKREFKKPKYLRDQLKDTERHFPIFYIHVVPLGNNLFRINIDDASKETMSGAHIDLKSKEKKSPKSDKDSVEVVGPLVDGVVVSGYILSTLVRQTCSNYMKKVFSGFESRVCPRIQRQQALASVVSRHTASLPSSQFYKSLFRSSLDPNIKKLKNLHVKQSSTMQGNS